jgi:hypothetical protein
MDRIKELLDRAGVESFLELTDLLLCSKDHYGNYMNSRSTQTAIYTVRISGNIYGIHQGKVIWKDSEDLLTELETEEVKALVIELSDEEKLSILSWCVHAIGCKVETIIPD